MPSSERLARSIGRQKCADCDANNVTDSLLSRRLAEIEQHWLKQRRQQRLNQLGCHDLAIVDREDSLSHFFLEIFR